MIKTHWFFVLTVWAMLLVALLIFPGFEAKAFFHGTIIGLWPIAMWGASSDGMAFLTLIILSAIELAVCAWVLDKARLPRRAQRLVLISIVIGALAMHLSNDYDYGDWVSSPAVAAAMETPEIQYEPNRWDFIDSVVIPKALVGGMWGLYASIGLCVLYATGRLFWRAAVRGFRGPRPRFFCKPEES